MSENALKYTSSRQKDQSIYIRIVNDIPDSSDLLFDALTERTYDEPVYRCDISHIAEDLRYMVEVVELQPLAVA